MKDFSTVIRLSLIRRIMEILNFFAILGIEMLISFTVYDIEHSDGARSYIEQISTIPYRPYQSALLTIAVFVALIWVIEYKGKANLASLEILCCIIVIYASHAIYNGILLLVIADIAANINERKKLIRFLAIMGVLYILLSYDIISMGIPMFSFQELIHIYPDSVQMLFIVIRDLLISFNLIIFIAYMIILIRNQMAEKEEIAALNEELRDANLKLRNYAEVQKQLGETEERNRIAREIHDTLGHTMTGLAAGLDACEMLIDFSVPETKNQIHKLSGVARSGLEDIRRSVNKLRPDVLEKNSLEEAIKKLIAETIEVSDVSIDYINEYGPLQFNPDEEEVLFRLVQEGTTNAIRHGKATHIWIAFYGEIGRFVVAIKDNGIGCDEIKPGFGIFHMKERLNLIHGTLDLDGSKGFSIVAKIPVRKGEEL